MSRHTDNLIRLVEALQATAEGLTLREIQARLAVSESTARRHCHVVGLWSGRRS